MYGLRRNAPSSQNDKLERDSNDEFARLKKSSPEIKYAIFKSASNRRIDKKKLTLISTRFIKCDSTTKRIIHTYIFTRTIDCFRTYAIERLKL